MELKKYQLMVLTVSPKASAYVRNNCTMYNNVKQVSVTAKIKGQLL